MSRSHWTVAFWYVLIISGSEDVHTTVAQTRALFAAANQPKELWLVPGARHVDLARYDSHGYADRVIGFLERHLVEADDGISTFGR